jgi:hypothetical protein
MKRYGDNCRNKTGFFAAHGLWGDLSMKRYGDNCRKKTGFFAAHGL